MTISEIIKNVEMVRDDLYERSNGCMCQRYVLTDAVIALQELTKTVNGLCDELEKREWVYVNSDNFHLPNDKETVLAEFAVKQEWDELPETYYFVCYYKEDGMRWINPIDGEPVTDKLIAWKYII